LPIIFYEYEYCEEIIKNGVKKITQKDLNLLSAYWKYKGESTEQIRKNIEEFCLKTDKNFNIIQSYKIIKRALRYCQNNILRFPTPITITKQEIISIQSVNDYKKEKFLFAMIVCAKFFKAHPSRKKITRSKYSDMLYSNNKIKDIQEIAGVKFSGKYWKELKHEFTLQGLISPTIVGSKRWAIGFNDDNSEPCLVIEDYRNIISYYQQYSGENMTECINCNVLIAKKSNRHSMCFRCWKNKKKEFDRNYIKKRYVRKLS
jgi:hypothetical protein